MSKPATVPAGSRSPDEAALIEQARAGDMSALSRLVSRYQDRIVNTCWRLCGNLDDAQELAQEAFLQATRHIGKFEQRAGFYTWLFRIAVNLSISHRRRSQRSPRLSLHMGDGAEMALTPASAWPGGRSESDQDPAARLTAREVHERVMAELDRLDEDHRSVLVLRDIEGLDYQQIAEVLELAVGTVKSRIHRARMEMRSRLREVVGVIE
jgi:RNA polymerase sigma-70 factor (ECF subfamily)